MLDPEQQVSLIIQRRKGERIYQCLGKEPNRAIAYSFWWVERTVQMEGKGGRFIAKQTKEQEGVQW